MTAAAIIALIESLTSAIPALAGLISGIKTSGTASPSDVLAILQKCGIDRAVFAANIAAQEAAGK